MRAKDSNESSEPMTNPRSGGRRHVRLIVDRDSPAARSSDVEQPDDDEAELAREWQQMRRALAAKLAAEHHENPLIVNGKPARAATIAKDES